MRHSGDIDGVARRNGGGPSVCVGVGGCLTERYSSEPCQHVPRNCLSGGRSLEGEAPVQGNPERNAESFGTVANVCVCVGVYQLVQHSFQ